MNSDAFERLERKLKSMGAALGGVTVGDGLFNTEELAEELLRSLETIERGEFTELNFNDSKMGQSISQSALEHYKECEGGSEEDPVERLRFFCSCAMEGQDWLDVEPFFTAILEEREGIYRIVDELVKKAPL